VQEQPHLLWAASPHKSADIIACRNERETFLRDTADEIKLPWPSVCGNDAKPAAAAVW
jgi:hypothetical protein